VKPGDEGENTISLHIDNNDAFACVDLSITRNADESCVDPENEAEGAGVCGSGDANLNGELAQNINFFAWDDDGDNIWEDGELPLFSAPHFGPASDVLGGATYMIAGPGSPLPGGSTSYIGLAWCAGTMSIDTVNEVIGCDGIGMGNDTQTDSLVANIGFRVEQARNNPNFTCTRVSEDI